MAVYEKAKRLAEMLGALDFIKSVTVIQVNDTSYPSFYHNNCLYVVVDDLFVDDMKSLRRKLSKMVRRQSHVDYEFLIPIELAAFIGTEFETTIFDDGTTFTHREMKNYDGTPNVKRIKKYLADSGFKNLYITNQGPV